MLSAGVPGIGVEAPEMLCLALIRKDFRDILLFLDELSPSLGKAPFLYENMDAFSGADWLGRLNSDNADFKILVNIYQIGKSHFSKTK